VAVGGTAPALIPAAFGARWGDAAAVLPWAAFGLLVAGPVSTAASGLLYARNRFGIPLRAVLAHTVAWFAVALPLIPSLGAEALGIGWCAGALVDVLILGRALASEGVRVVRPCCAPVVAGLAVGAVGWLVASSVRPPALGLVASLICVELLYLLAMSLVRRGVLIDLLRLVRRTLTPEPAPGPTSARSS
jgi:O-antigen/teichoic acid export membrane protein